MGRVHRKPARKQRSRCRRTTAGGKSSAAEAGFKRNGLKELERENAKLQRLVAELVSEKQILKDVASGNF